LEERLDVGVHSIVLRMASIWSQAAANFHPFARACNASTRSGQS
jgi:hypothetical protein